jgi:hypothetical protein
MRLERDLFSRWCNLVFRGSMGNGPLRNFEDGLDKVITASTSLYLQSSLPPPVGSCN